MASPSSSEVKLKIGHVLFIDIVNRRLARTETVAINFRINLLP
jgi:hypothetical protein